MGTTAAGTLARMLIGSAALVAGSSAGAQDSLAGAIFGAGAGAIIGHSVGGPDAAVAGGIIGALTGAAIASHQVPGVAVHYRGGHGYPPPAVYPRRPRAPVVVLPPPGIVFIPGRGHGYWHHGVDGWGRPYQSWVPAAPPRGYYYAPAPYPRHHHPGYRYGGRPDHRW